jgi:acetyl-CoA carboxylase biotin carboxyl carrier protein
MGDEKRTDKEKPAMGPGMGKVDIESLRQLLALMSEHDLAELEIEQEDLVVRLRKGGAAVVPVAAPVAAVPSAAPAAEAETAKLPTINSPMVGTFYAAPSPEAPPFVKVGDHVMEDTVVCVIEAMKVFNEIRAETSGTIEKILGKNAAAVEFGQALFVVRPDS